VSFLKLVADFAVIAAACGVACLGFVSLVG
jgi:hypothetical protein